MRDPASLVRLERRSPENITPQIPYASVVFYREHTKTLSAVMVTLGSPGVQFDQDLQPSKADYVSANDFSELGAQPAAGTLQLPADLHDAPAVVFSYGFWQRRFGGDRSIIGRVIRINHKPATVIGTLPQDFASLDQQHPDLWLPLSQQPYFVEGSDALTNTNGGGNCSMWGRLAPGHAVA